MDIDQDVSENSERKKIVSKLLSSLPDYLQKVQCDTNKDTAPFKCGVTSCPNMYLSYEQRNTLPYKFHNFPTDPDLLQKWKTLCRLGDSFNPVYIKVCSNHFELDDYLRNYKEEFRNPNFTRKLKPDAVPSLNLEGEPIPQVISHFEDPEDVRRTVDEYGELRKQFDNLLNYSNNIRKKISIYKKRIRNKKVDIESIKKQLSLMKYKSTNHQDFLSKVFSKSQINLLMGKKKVVWSDDDLAMAFSLRHIGNKETYLYLKNVMNFPLPALSCVQKWAASS